MRRHSLICRFDAGDRARVQPVQADSAVTQVRFVSADDHFDYGLGDLLDSLVSRGLQPLETAFDLALISAMVFCADTRISRNDAQDDWTREIDLYLPVQNVDLWRGQKFLLSRMLRFLTGDEWRIFFRERPRRFQTIVPLVEQAELPQFTCASLFSGGLDSYIGAIDLLAAGETPLLVSHYMDGATSQHQRMCITHLEKAYSQISFEALRTYVCFETDLVPNSEGDSNQRSRSFLFFGLGVLAASTLAAKGTLYVPENGLISLNVPLDPLRLGSLSTRTTHPFYMARFSELLDGLGLCVSLVNPYRHMTKGEMVAACKNLKLLRATAKNTMSCSSPAKARWKKLAPGHCGYCVPCLIRRAAILKGLKADNTYYQLSDLASGPLNSAAAEGQHVRSFQLSLAKISASSTLSDTAIHSPGPLTDVPDEWPDLRRVYKEGLKEVGKIIEKAVVRP